MNKYTRSIQTAYDPPPIPDRSYDWMASRSDYDKDEPIGYGKTEQESIKNLIEQEEDRYE